MTSQIAIRNQLNRIAQGGRNQPGYDEDFFMYVVQAGTLAQNATSIQQLTIQADSHFEWIKSTYYGTLAIANNGLPPFEDAQFPEVTVLIQDNGSGRNLTTAPVPISSMAGTGREPFILNPTRYFEAKSTVQFTFTSFATSNVAYNNVTLTLLGRKIFTMG